MPFKMIANRSVYRIDDGKEYKKGESFTVKTEKDRDRLVKTKRASVATEAEVKRPVVVQKVMTAEKSTPSPAAETSQPELPKPNRYRRGDMRAED